MRAGWRALVAANVLRKALHRTRPYETVAGIERQGIRRERSPTSARRSSTSCSDTGCQLKAIVEAMRRSRERFRRVAVRLRSTACR